VTQTAADISTDALRAALQQQLGQPIASLRRRPWEYATSNRMEALDIELVDGGRLSLLLKDLSPHAQLDAARRTRPTHHFDPRREIETYRHILAVADVDAPHFYGASGDWLFIENVAGVPLWQREYDVWPAAAKWLARFHMIELPSPPASLIRYTVHYCRGWANRAVQRHPQLASFDFEPVVRRLASLPQRLIHGEFYASNVLVQGGDRIRPIDWETAAVGPALIDVAALTSGNIPATHRDATIGAYRDVTSASNTFDDDLKICRLHLALQWLGWSDDWTPPREHAQDWRAEAVQLATELGAWR
jgi:hypothetical protein